MKVIHIRFGDSKLMQVTSVRSDAPLAHTNSALNGGTSEIVLQYSFVGRQGIHEFVEKTVVLGPYKTLQISVKEETSQHAMTGDKVNTHDDRESGKSTMCWLPSHARSSKPLLWRYRDWVAGLMLEGSRKCLNFKAPVR